MIADARIWTRPARQRRLADDLLWGVPVALAATLSLGLAGRTAALVAALVGTVVLAIAVRRDLARYDRAWLVRRLDADPALEDSAALLFADPAPLRPLQRLQRARLSERLVARAPRDLRPGWSRRRIAIGWMLVMLTGVALLGWRARPRPERLAPSSEGVVVRPGVPQLIGQRLRVVPPGYTGLPARDLDALDARAPEGSRLVWTLAFAPQPGGAALDLLDGRRVALTRAGERWSAALTLDRSVLYRVTPVGARALARLHRLDAIPDRPPEVVAVPPRRVTLATPGQRGWSIAFTATDDYGVAPTARLRLSVAAGEGENLQFSEHVLTLRGTGAARARRFAATIDLVRLGFTGPGDLVAQLTVADTRAPGAHVVQGPSLILRRAAVQAALGSGVGAMPTPVLAYLRSQRQVIIDAEALLRERRALPPARFLERSVRIGDDQGALRGRYGQFLGQETEGAAALPTADAGAPAGFGKIGDVTAEYGHAHDQAEGATLFDPITRAKLQGAVDQMWQSEGALRQGDPARALPFANRALVLIKQVQQATRVFVAKVGTELPPIDETRRLTGKRDDLNPNDLALAPRAASEAGAAAVWAAIDSTPGHALRLDALTRWLAENRARIADPLALAGAIDAVRRARGCEPCRAVLRGLVWRALDRPPPGVTRRGEGDAAGRRYLGEAAR